MSAQGEHGLDRGSLVQGRRASRSPPGPPLGPGIQRPRYSDRADSPAPTGGGPRCCSVEDLRIEFLTNGEWLPVIEDVSFAVPPGQTLGLVGESGSGKTVSALAVMGLLPPGGRRATGIGVRFGGRDLMRLGPGELRQIRGNEISMIFQEPMTSLNPAYTVGNQIAEQVRVHRALSRERGLEGRRRDARPSGDPRRRRTGPATTPTRSRAACANG